MGRKQKLGILHSLHEVDLCTFCQEEDTLQRLQLSCQYLAFLRDIPMIVMSGTDEREMVRVDCEVLIKPLSLESVLAAVERHTSGTKASLA